MISVIIPTYNRAHLLKRAINSVLNQTYKDIEVIIVDDCSEDNTKEVVNSIESKKIRYIRLENNSGACKARNVGIKKSSGEYIAFLDSDDEWCPDKLEKQYNYLIMNESNIVVCNYNYEKWNKTKLAMRKSNNFITYDELLYKNYVTTGAILTKKSILEDVGFFDESMPRYQDWELALRISKKYKIGFMDEPLLTLHYQQNSITNSTSKKKKYIALEKMYKENKKGYDKNHIAKAHLSWSMGMYSLYSDDIKMNLLKDGVYAAGVNYKRLIIYILIKIGFKEPIKKAYAINH